jgi:hypothetical protein
MRTAISKPSGPAQQSGYLGTMFKPQYSQGIRLEVAQKITYNGLRQLVVTLIRSRPADCMDVTNASGFACVVQHRRARS